MLHNLTMFLMQTSSCGEAWFEIWLKAHGKFKLFRALWAKSQITPLRRVMFALKTLLNCVTIRTKKFAQNGFPKSHNKLSAQCFNKSHPGLKGEQRHIWNFLKRGDDSWKNKCSIIVKINGNSYRNRYHGSSVL